MTRRSGSPAAPGFRRAVTILSLGLLLLGGTLLVGHAAAHGAGGRDQCPACCLVRHAPAALSVSVTLAVVARKLWRVTVACGPPRFVVLPRPTCRGPPLF